MIGADIPLLFLVHGDIRLIDHVVEPQYNG